MARHEDRGRIWNALCTREVTDFMGSRQGDPGIVSNFTNGREDVDESEFRQTGFPKINSY